MSASRALQKAIFNQLNAANLGLEVFDNIPNGAAFPYISFGPTSFVPEDAECIRGRTETVQLDVWGDDQGKVHPTKDAVDRVYAALHDAQLILDDPYAAVTTTVTLARVFKDRDAIRAQGVVQVQAVIQEV